MYKNIVFDFGGVMVDFDPHKYLIDLFGNRGLEEEVYDLTFGSREWRLLDAGGCSSGPGPWAGASRRRACWTTG